MKEYENFIRNKSFRHVDAGFSCPEVLPYPLFDYQEPLVRWACKRGKAALFADTGLGKTIMQLAWADQVAKHTGGPVIILAPLAVSLQTIDEGKKYGIHVEKANPGAAFFGPNIVITNYEQIHKFDPDVFQGIVIDESSILKGMQGKRRQEITDFGMSIKYRLSCTATPSPNDFMELGTQAEFLGIMSQIEMLAMFFIHDGGDVSKWRLKGHGQSRFFEWMATWAAVIRSPTDLGFDGSRHVLPKLHYHSHVVETTPEDALFVEPAQGLQDRNKARKDSVDARVAVAAELANSMEGQVLIWCNLNDESERLTKSITDAVEVKGSDKPDHKVNAVGWFLGYSGYVTNKRGEVTLCHDQNMTSRNIEKIEKFDSLKQRSGRKETKTTEKNTCESTQRKTEKSLQEQKSSKTSITKEEEIDTQLTKNIEKEKRARFQNISGKTLKRDSQTDSEFTESHLLNIEKLCYYKMVDAPYADALILDAQKKKGSTLITATQQGLSEDCFAQTAIKPLENSKTTLKGSEQQQDTSKRVLISKPRIFGYGLNLQNCHQIIFVGLSDSWESYYQAIRRCWRFGQLNEVHIHVVSADTEGAVIENIMKKDKNNQELGASMVEHMKTMMDKEIFSAATEKTEYEANIKMENPEWL